MKLFHETGCLTEEGLRALTAGRLTELERLEAAEHLSYCDRCLDRYTMLLSKAPLEAPLHDLVLPVRRSIWVRLMQNNLGRGAVAAAAAVLALTLWGSGAFRMPKWQVALPNQKAVSQSVAQSLETARNDLLAQLPFQIDFAHLNGGNHS